MADSVKALAEGERAAAFFDVDGTLIYRKPGSVKINPDGSRRKLSHDEFFAPAPSERVRAAFETMAQRGHAPFICTGRPVFLLPDALRALPIAGYVASAGAFVQVGDTVVRDEHIPYDLLMETARTFIDLGVSIDMEANDLVVGIYPVSGENFFPDCPTVRTVEDFEPYARTHHFAKFCIHGGTREMVDRVRPFCEAHYTICDMQFETFEFSLKGLDKGTGIQAALAALGEPVQRTFAFGDSENDLSMANAVDTFVAMDNALPGVKDQADYVTDSVECDGVATALERFGVI